MLLLPRCHCHFAATFHTLFMVAVLFYVFVIFVYIALCNAHAVVPHLMWDYFVLKMRLSSRQWICDGKGTIRITSCNNVALSILYAPGEWQRRSSVALKRVRIFRYSSVESFLFHFHRSLRHPLSFRLWHASSCAICILLRYILDSDVMRSINGLRAHSESHRIKSNEIFMTRVLRWCFSV